MKRMQLDTVDVFCRYNLPFILEGVPKSNGYLSDFTCDFTKSSYQATIYEVLYYQLYLIINPDKINNFNLLSSHHYVSYIYQYSRNITNQDVKINL
jgi:hypothetical protein